MIVRFSFFLPPHPAMETMKNHTETDQHHFLTNIYLSGSLLSYSHRFFSFVFIPYYFCMFYMNWIIEDFCIHVNKYCYKKNIIPNSKIFLLHEFLRKKARKKDVSTYIFYMPKRLLLLIISCIFADFSFVCH